MENWKNSRAEHEMQEHDKKVVKEAIKASKKAEDEKWNKIIKVLCTGDLNEDNAISFTVNKMRNLYQLPQELKK